jgi:hypothetical protein
MLFKFRGLPVNIKKGFAMSNSKKEERFPRAQAIVLVILLLFGFRCAAQDEHALHEVYQAQAMGQNTQVGQTFNVTVHIDEYSTPEERKILLDAFDSGGSKGLYNALDKMPARGHIAITGTLGYDIKFARKIPMDEGFKIIVVTNRPVNFREVWNSSRSLDYNLSYLELTLNKETGKGTGTLIPAAEFKIDKKSGELTIEAFNNPWALTNVQDRTKK